MQTKRIIFFIIILFLFCFGIGTWFLYSEIYIEEAQNAEKISFEIKKGENIKEISDRLEKQQVIRNKWLFQKYLYFKGLDKELRAGTFEVKEPITLSKVAEALKQPSVEEMKITIIPGWDLYEIAEYLEKKGIADDKQKVFEITGRPAKTDENYVNIFDNPVRVLQQKPVGLSLEGYLKPDTYRIFKDASTKEVITKLIKARNRELKGRYEQIKKKKYNIHEVLTVASILEREARSFEDKKKIADIFYRRNEKNWPLQADSTVHYIFGQKGEIFTTDKQRESLNPYNTYQYPGLPPGPISNPGIKSIKAAIHPTENDYWYFLTTKNGKVYYSESLMEHNQKVQKYLRK